MLTFKPDEPEALIESSDDLEGFPGGGEEDSSDADDDSEDDDEEEEEDGNGGENDSQSRENPFYEDSDEDSDMSEAEEDKTDAACDDEDDLIKALQAARQKKERNCPPDLKCSELITDLSFHPEEDVIVIGNISGDLSVFSYSNEENKLKKKLKLSKKTIRGVEFDESGSSLLTISKDKTFRVLDVESWTVKEKYVKCHDSALYSCLSLDPHTSVTGDEDGFVKMWDSRQPNTSVMTFKRFEEYVSSFLKIDDHHLIASSGEGTIQSFDLRQKRPDIQSEMYESELNCLTTVRSGSKLVVGSGAGPLYLFR